MSSVSPQHPQAHGRQHGGHQHGEDHHSQDAWTPLVAHSHESHVDVSHAQQEAQRPYDRHSQVHEAIVAQDPTSELADFLDTLKGPAAVSPQNPLSQQAAPSANKANPMMNPSNPGAFNNPSNPQLNPDLPGSTTNPSNPQYNPDMPGAENNRANPTFNQAMPGATNNPANPALNPAFPGSITNPANPIHNPDYPDPSKVGQPPTNLGPNASFPPQRWTAVQVSPTGTDDTSKWGWHQRRPVIYDPTTQMVHVGPDGWSHPQLLQSMWSVPVGQQDRDRGNYEVSMGWYGTNPEALPQDYVFNRGRPNEIGWYSSTPRPSMEAHKALEQFAQQNPIHALTTASIKVADSYTQDTHEWADPTEPRASKPPLPMGCTCPEGHKLDCPIHGMNAPNEDADHTWFMPEGWPVGYPQDQPRGWTDAVQSSRVAKAVKMRSFKLGKYGKGMIQSEEAPEALIWRIKGGWNGSPHHDEVKETLGVVRPCVAFHIDKDGRFYFHEEDEGFTKPKNPDELASEVERQYPDLRWGCQSVESYERQHSNKMGGHGWYNQRDGQGDPHSQAGSPAAAHQAALQGLSPDARDPRGNQGQTHHLWALPHVAQRLTSANPEVDWVAQNYPQFEHVGYNANGHPQYVYSDPQGNGHLVTGWIGGGTKKQAIQNIIPNLKRQMYKCTSGACDHVFTEDPESYVAQTEPGGQPEARLLPGTQVGYEGQPHYVTAADTIDGSHIYDLAHAETGAPVEMVGHDELSPWAQERAASAAAGVQQGDVVAVDPMAVELSSSAQHVAGVELDDPSALKVAVDGPDLGADQLFAERVGSGAIALDGRGRLGGLGFSGDIRHGLRLSDRTHDKHVHAWRQASHHEQQSVVAWGEPLTIQDVGDHVIGGHAGVERGVVDDLGLDVWSLPVQGGVHVEGSELRGHAPIVAHQFPPNGTHACPSCGQGLISNGWTGWTPMTEGQFGQRTWQCPSCGADYHTAHPLPRGHSGLAQEVEQPRLGRAAELAGLMQGAGDQRVADLTHPDVDLASVWSVGLDRQASGVAQPFGLGSIEEEANVALAATSRGGYGPALADSLAIAPGDPLDVWHEMGRSGYETHESSVACTSTYWHTAPTTERDRILQHGLQPSDPAGSGMWTTFDDDKYDPPKGVYISPNRKWLDGYRTRLEFKRGVPHDVWEIDDPGGYTYPDPDLGLNSRYVMNPIPNPRLVEGPEHRDDMPEYMMRGYVRPHDPWQRNDWWPMGQGEGRGQPYPQNDPEAWKRLVGSQRTAAGHWLKWRPNQYGRGWLFPDGTVWHWDENGPLHHHMEAEARDAGLDPSQATSFDIRPTGVVRMRKLPMTEQDMAGIRQLEDRVTAADPTVQGYYNQQARQQEARDWDEYDAQQAGQRQYEAEEAEHQRYMDELHDRDYMQRMMDEYETRPHEQASAEQAYRERMGLDQPENPWEIWQQDHYGGRQSPPGGREAAWAPATEGDLPYNHGRVREAAAGCHPARVWQAVRPPSSSRPADGSGDSGGCWSSADGAQAHGRTASSRGGWPGGEAGRGGRDRSWRERTTAHRCPVCDESFGDTDLNTCPACGAKDIDMMRTAALEGVDDRWRSLVLGPNHERVWYNPRYSRWHKGFIDTGGQVHVWPYPQVPADAGNEAWYQNEEETSHANVATHRNAEMMVLDPDSMEQWDSRFTIDGRQLQPDMPDLWGPEHYAMVAAQVPGLNPHQAAQQLMYHVSPVANREAITQYGLDYTRGQAQHEGMTPGNYLWPAPTFMSMSIPMGREHEYDRWEVDAEGLPLEQDPDTFFGRYTTQPVSADRLRRIEGRVQSPDSLRTASPFVPPQPDEHLPVDQVMSQYRPIEARTWDQVRQRYERDYPEHLEALRQSMAKGGMINPIQLDTKRGIVGDGHTRLLAAQDLGMTHVPVVYREHGYWPDTDDWVWDRRTDEHNYDPPDEPISPPRQARSALNSLSTLPSQTSPQAHARSAALPVPAQQEGPPANQRAFELSQPTRGTNHGPTVPQRPGWASNPRDQDYVRGTLAQTRLGHPRARLVPHVEAAVSQPVAQRDEDERVHLPEPGMQQWQPLGSGHEVIPSVGQPSQAVVDAPAHVGVVGAEQRVGDAWHAAQHRPSELWMRAPLLGHKRVQKTIGKLAGDPLYQMSDENGSPKSRVAGDLEDQMKWKGGGCGALAHHLHQQTGWPIVGELYDPEDADQRPDHFGVLHPSGEVLDFNGLHEWDDMRHRLLDPEELEGHMQEGLLPHHTDPQYSDAPQVASGLAQEYGSHIWSPMGAGPGPGSHLSMAADPEWWQQYISEHPYGYHGTYADDDSILKHGLLPWDHPDNPEGSWQYKDTVTQPRPDHVYMSKDPWVEDYPSIWKVDLSKLDPARVSPDEDWYSDRGGPRPWEEAGIEPWEVRKPEPFGDTAERLDFGRIPEHTHRSVGDYGRWAYRGVIPPEALSPYTSEDHEQQAAPTTQTTLWPSLGSHLHQTPWIPEWEAANPKTAAVTRDEFGNPSIVPWEPGTWGKGMMVDGRPHIWQVENPGGSPHHMQVGRSMGYDPATASEEEWNRYHDYIQIAPDGSYTLDPQGTKTRTPEAFARSGLGLRYVRDPDRWQMRAFSSRQAAVPIKYHAAIDPETLSGSLKGYAGRWPMIWDGSTLHIGPEGSTHLDVRDRMGISRDYEETRDVPGIAEGWIGPNPDIDSGWRPIQEEYDPGVRVGWYDERNAPSPEVGERAAWYHNTFLRPSIDPNASGGYGHGPRMTSESLLPIRMHSGCPSCGGPHVDEETGECTDCGYGIGYDGHESLDGNPWGIGQPMARTGMAAEPDWWSQWVAEHPYAYHGTNEEDLSGFDRHGIVPWDHPLNPVGSPQFADTVTSPRPGHVYLSTEPPDPADYMHTYRVDLSKLDPRNVNPDEDWFSDTFPGGRAWNEVGVEPWDVRQHLDRDFGQTAERLNFGQNPEHTHQSVGDYGRFGYRGIIPPEALSYHDGGSKMDEWGEGYDRYGNPLQWNGAEWVPMKAASAPWRLAETDSRAWEGKMYHGSPNGLLGPVRTPFWAFSDPSEDSPVNHPVSVRFQKPLRFWGQIPPFWHEIAQRGGHDGIVVQGPQGAWTIALDPGTVVPGHDHEWPY